MTTLRLLLTAFSLVLGLSCQNHAQKISPPNILWIIIEDLTPMLGCYGDSTAVTPNIDQLAARGVRYTHAFATAAVCAPSRSCLVTGIYAPTLGTQHLRSTTTVPPSIHPFPHYLREAGYFCSNSSKEDFNFEIPNIWDQTEEKIHWRGRKENQAFFSVFNLSITHQSKIFGSDEVYEERIGEYRNQIQRTRPEDVQLPPYSFDSPEIRKLWARYYDNVKIVDLQVKEILDALEADGLAGNTLVFFFSDHGTGMPRGKRALYDSGLQVPLIVAAPPEYQETLGLKPGTVRNDLVSFIDFAPTVLNLFELEIPKHMQGQPFLGQEAKREREFVFATSDRVDEAYEAVRSIRTSNFRYLRNYFPHRPLIQPNYYSDQSEINQINQNILHTSDSMTPAQQSMWWPKRAVEELYHIPDDPFETNNLAGDPAYAEILAELRQKNRDRIRLTRDSGLMPEAYMYKVSEGSTPYETLQNEAIFPIDSILNLLDQLYFERPSEARILAYLNHKHPLMKYWALIALQYQETLNPAFLPRLKQLVHDEETFVAITAGEVLCQYGHLNDGIDVILKGLQSENEYILLMAARAFEWVPDKPAIVMAAGRKEWLRLKDATAGKWKGYDLYAYWSLSQVFGKE